MSVAPLNPIDQLLADAPGVAGAVLARQDRDRIEAWFEDAPVARAVRILNLLDARSAGSLLLGTGRFAVAPAAITASPFCRRRRRPSALNRRVPSSPAAS